MVDLIVKGGFVITVDKNRRIIYKGAVAIEDGRIIAVDKSERILKEYKAETVIGGDDKIVMPGLICAHCHTHGRVAIGMPVELPVEFYDILSKWWWPMIEDQLTKDDVYVLSRASCTEMVKRGITCIGDVMEAPNALPGVLESEAKAFLEVGVRGVLAFEATERISKENGELGIQENLNFVRKWNKPESLVKGLFCVHTVFSCSPEMLMKVRDLANKHKAGIHLHVEESVYEVNYCKRTYGKLPVEHLRDIGFLGPDVLAAQCVQTSDQEIKILKEYDVKVAHNPQSNMECGVGIAPVVKMLDEGITVSLGTDGLFPDMFETMRTAYLVHKGYLRDPTVLPAETIIEMATINGAKSLRIENETGSIELGKRADLVIFSIPSPGPITADNLCSLVMYLGSGEYVDTVIVDGKIIVEEGKVKTVNEEEVRKKAFEIYTDMLRRNKLEIKEESIKL